MRIVLPVVAALLVAALPARADPVSVTDRVSHEVGSRWLGADLTRGVRASHTGERVEVEVTTEARLRLATAALPVFRLRERTVGSALRARPRLWRGTEVSILGTSKLTVTQTLFKRSFKVRSVKMPVATVGPFPVTLEAEVGAFLSLKLKGETAWRDGPSAAGGVEAQARLGATARLGPGAPLVKVGVKGEVDLLKAKLPAMVTLYRDAAVFEVKVVVESRAAIKLFARLGVGPFTREVTVGVSFLSWHAFKKEVTLARRELRL